MWVGFQGQACQWPSVWGVRSHRDRVYKAGGGGEQGHVNKVRESFCSRLFPSIEYISGAKKVSYGSSFIAAVSHVLVCSVWSSLPCGIFGVDQTYVQ